MYSRNDVDGVLRNVRTLRPSIAEVVVVDSSDPPQRARLAEGLRPPGERICPAPPLGNIDLLRPYGLAQMSTDRVLQLDADEVPSPALVAHLSELDAAEAYVLPRWEEGARGYTYHLRLVRRTHVRYAGPSYGFPQVDGTTTVLARPFRLVHSAAPGERYWSDGDRRRRYLPSDLLERPYDRRYLRRTVRGRAGPADPAPDPARPRSEPPLSPGATRLVLWIEAARSFLTSGSWGIARMRLEQGRQRRIFWERLTSDQQRWFTDTAPSVRTAGGLVGFLGFDDVAYVERLSRTFGPEIDGPSLLDFLLHERSRTGRPWDGASLPPKFHVTPA